MFLIIIVLNTIYQHSNIVFGHYIYPSSFFKIIRNHALTSKFNTHQETVRHHRPVPFRDDADLPVSVGVEATGCRRISRSSRPPMHRCSSDGSHRRRHPSPRGSACPSTP